jgi:hypothetical protein
MLQELYGGATTFENGANGTARFQRGVDLFQIPVDRYNFAIRANKDVREATLP